MQNTLLVETLSWLTPEEMQELSLFIQSEFHNNGNSRADTIRLFAVLSDIYPHFDDERTQKEILYRLVFPNLPTYQSKIEKLFSDLYKIVKNYLIWKQYHQKQNEFQRSLDWAKAIKKNITAQKLDDVLSKIEKDFITNTRYSSQLLYEKYQLERLRQEWQSEVNKGKEDVNINNSLLSLCLFFEGEKLELSNQLLIQKKITRIEVPEQVQHILNMPSTLIPTQKNPVIAILSHIHQLLNTEIPDYEQFKYLITLLQKHEPQLDPDALRKYYTYLRNICTIIINAGRNDLLEILHELQRDNLERGYLYYEGKLHTNTLANLTRIAINTGNTDWAISCIEMHKDKMFGDIETNDYYLINKALCYFSQHKFQLVLDILPPSSPNVFYHLIARRLELMCYYELKSELLLYKLEAFKVYIWRASEKFLSENLKNSNKAFINFFLQLVAIPPGDKKKLMRLEFRIKQKKHISESKWLLSKVQTR